MDSDAPVVRLLWLALLLALGASNASAEPISVTDDTGRTVTISQPATRIVSLAPHLTEILFELGVGDEITGTVRWSDYPPAARKIPRLGDAFSVSVESVVATKPDIVFAWRSGGSDRALEKIQALGIPVYFNEAKRLADIAQSVRNIARLVGKEEKGDALASDFTERLSALARKPGNDPVKVFFQISDQNLYTVNGQHLIGQAISLCGATNPFADASAPVPLVSKEAVIAAQPDLIIITRSPDSPASPWAAEWARYAGLKGKVRWIDPDLISRPGLRMALGVEQMCALIRQAGQQ